MDESRNVVRGHLLRWAEDLIDLSRRNRLLYFAHTRSASFEFAQPADEIETRLGSRRGWGFYLPPPPEVGAGASRNPAPTPAPDELVVSLKPERQGPEIERGLKTLKTKTDAQFLDTGLWTMYMGLGRLEWVDVDGKPAQSPLLLMPVALTQDGADKIWRVRLSEDGEPAINPALAVKLQRDFGIRLPTIDDPDIPEPNVTSVLAAIRNVVASESWNVTPATVLRPFTFHKEVIYRDLVDNKDEIEVHPIVRLLAEGPGSTNAEELHFDPEPEEAMDERHPPEDLTCVLDADVTQRQCLIAARGGRSFVMDGPPGTGKSQTITNVIAQLLKDGKTVLFVSEKAAALEVVENHLKDRHLDPFILTLHSHVATRKAIAQELGSALEQRPRATSRLDATSRARAVRDRRRLTDYASAVNEIRQPLGRSLHDVIGRTAQLDRLPALPIPMLDTTRLDPDLLEELLDAGRAMGRAWGPVERAEAFLWRDLARPVVGGGRESDLARRARALAAAVTHLGATVESVADELRLAPCEGPKDAYGMLALLELLDQRPAIGERWLTTQDTDGVSQAVGQLAAMLRDLDDRERVLSSSLPGWRGLEARLAEELAGAEAELSTLSPPLGPLDAWYATALQQLAGVLTDAAAVIRRLEQPAAVLKSAFNVTSEPAIELVARLAALGELAASPNPPEAAWLNPIVKPAIDEARRVLSELLQTYRGRRDALKDTFKESVLTLDLRAIQGQVDEGGLHKLSQGYRQARRTLAAAAMSGKADKEILAKLHEAIAWQDLAKRLEDAERRFAGHLGQRLWPSRNDADLDAIERAIAVADQALVLAAADVAPADLARQIGFNGDADERLPSAIMAVRAAMTSLRQGPFGQHLGPVASAVEMLTPSHAADWCAAASRITARLATVLAELDSIAQRSCLLSEARPVLVGRRDAEGLAAAVRTMVDGYTEILGRLSKEPSADALDAALRWVESVRQLLGGVVRPRTAAAVLGTSVTPDNLRDPLSSYDKAASALFGEFTPAYGRQLRDECDASFDAARSLPASMTASIGEIQEWSSFAAAREVLLDAGLEPTVSACAEQRIDASEVGGVIERAILIRWVDEVIAADKRLEPHRAVSRDDLVFAFRQLDEELVENAAAGVINACADRRPRSLAGGAGLIKQQSLLKRRHKPVRVLLDEAGEAAQMLKPCFMMSPLSVSQFLPPTLTFDAVVFDEASQVREADAICSIYRGRQLIVAGDPKQLPPTDFFDASVQRDDDDGGDDDSPLDFESVLDRGKAQGLPELKLNWHYRSRHESLITYSNRSFYGGRLHTFPGATFEAPDLGVALYLVDGEYRRGTTRDNPIEAEMVVDRILHHRRNHPAMTIGVVALSGAQQTCIEAAMERRRVTEPDLRDLVTDDRLRGFFVKNLENVQGDERDLIVLSIGYGRDEHGRLTMNFGPMNREGGQRRLNVAVTRARRRVEVISSVTAGDIRSDTGSLRHLARYLDYAERGVSALATEVDQPQRDPDSPFEEEVLGSVRELGFDADAQVGVAGYRLDIGVRHPAKPGSFVLGIECDGRAYHSSKVARDRDRIRQQVLEGLGWRIHRIWSTAWFTDRAGETARVKAVIEAQLSGKSGVPSEQRPSARTVDISVDEFQFDAYPEWAYVFDTPVVKRQPILGLDFTSVMARPIIIDQITDAVNEYGPLHWSTLLDAIRIAWQQERAGPRIREAYQSAVRVAIVNGKIEGDGDFVVPLGHEAYVRVPTRRDTVRKVAHVHPVELELAIVNLLQDAGASSPVRLRTEWARLFGWHRVGSDIEDAFDDAVNRLMAQGRVQGPDPLRLAN